MKNNFKKSKKNLYDWYRLRKKVISSCPYFAAIQPQIKSLKLKNIPPVLKLFINEAIADFIFGLYFSTIILCRTACEVALKHFAINNYIEKCPSKVSISKSVIDRILRSDLNDLQYILEYSNLITPSIKSITSDVANFGNIHIHGNIDKIIEAYLKSSITKTSLLNYCLRLKKLDYMFSPGGLMEFTMLECLPGLEKIQITKEEAKEILEGYPDALRGLEVMPLAKRLLISTLKLYGEIFK